MKVHKVELLIVDHDDVGASELPDILENARYPNRCISPSVMDVKTIEVEWTDDHPLNMQDEMAGAYRNLFNLPTG